MDKETVAIIIGVLVLGYFAYAAFLEAERRKWYKRYRELEEFIDACDNTRENWHRRCPHIAQQRTYQRHRHGAP